MRPTHHALATCLLMAIYSAGLPPQAVAEPPAHPRELVFPDVTWRPPAADQSRVALPGGATALLVQDDVLPLVDIIIVARAGAALDPTDRRGLSELTSTMLRRGGAGERSADAFDRRADELGAHLFSVSTALYGAAGLRCTSEVLTEAVELLLDMVERPRFEPGRLDDLKSNMTVSLGRRNLDPSQVLEREWNWLMYGDDHFSTRPIRDRDLALLESADLAAFHRIHWQPTNFWIAVAGDIDAEQLRALLGERFASWPNATTAGGPWPPPAPSHTPSPGLFHVEVDIPQAKIALGHRAAADLPSVEERVRLEVMGEILAGRGAISRLAGRLRSAEGLVYRVTADLDPGDLWPADFEVRFDTLAANTSRVIAATLQELDRMRSTHPHPDELAIVKRELIARMQQDFDTAEEAAGYLVEDALVTRPEQYRTRYQELVESTTVEDVLTTARRYLRPQELVILTAGRWSEISGPSQKDGKSLIERTVGSPVTPLPARDPLTLDPLIPAPYASQSSSAAATTSSTLGKKSNSSGGE